MSSRKEINKQLRKITELLVSKSISISQNYPVYKDNQLSWSNYQNIAFSLKDEPYEIIYESCRSAKDYNFMLIDGALIQMQYEFKRNNIIGHILNFLPNPDIERFQDNPEEFEKLYYGIQLFSDILDRKTIVFPIRFDFTQVHNEIIHPKVHATLGGYTDCRIPVNKPISPKRFMHFILRNFYYYKFTESSLENEFDCGLSFSKEITNNEENLIHFSYN